MRGGFWGCRFGQELDSREDQEHEPKLLNLDATPDDPQKIIIPRTNLEERETF